MVANYEYDEQDEEEQQPKEQNLTPQAPAVNIMSQGPVKINVNIQSMSLKTSLSKV